MATVILGDAITVQVIDPANVGGPAHRRPLQDRTFFEYRNKGFVLLHTHTVDPASKKRVQLPQPIVVEMFPDLKKYHQPNYVYTLATRKSYNVATYVLFLSLCQDGRHPFKSVNELLNYRELEINVPSAEQPMAKDFKTRGSVFQLPGYHNLRFDALAMNTQSSAILTTTAVPLTETVLKEFHNQCHFAHYFTSKTQDLRIATPWKQFFSKPVHLHMGCPSEVSPGLLSLAKQHGINLWLRKGVRFVLHP
jgi:hypothetical protein